LTYRVEVSRGAQAFLKALAQEDRARCRRLALPLLRLEKTPRPPESRRLKGSEESEDRAWEFAGFLIAYRLHEAGRLVEVGVVKKTR